MLALKRVHTEKVVEHARRILESNRTLFSEETARAGLLAALYHDVGRFPQYARWKTFSDALSVNHGQLGCALLRREAFLEGETETVRRLVRVAVCLHNRHLLPKGLSHQERLVTDVVRDADKLDIFRIMTRFLTGEQRSDDVVLHVQDEPLKWTPEIAKDVHEGRVPSYRRLVYVNDFRILLASWIYDLRFASSRGVLAASGHVEAVLAGLPEDPALLPVLEKLRDQLRKVSC